MPLLKCSNWNCVYWRGFGSPEQKPRFKDTWEGFQMRIGSIFSFATALYFLLPANAQEVGPLVLSRTIPLPKVQGGFNHMSVDAERRRLFAAAPTNHTLEVIDVNSRRVLRSLEGESPAAARFAPEFNQLYVTRGTKVYIYDGNTFDLLTSVDLDCRLDELHYDARARRLYVGCMTPGKTAVAMIGIPEGKLLGVVKLPARPQGFVVEGDGKRIFANMPMLKRVAVIDREKQTLLETWPIKKAQANYPIALDEAHRRLFVGCRKPARLVVLDTSTGKPVAAVGICGIADDLFYDPPHKRLYVSCVEGSVDVIDQRDADHYQLRQRIPTVDEAGNSAFSEALNAFFLGVPRREDQPAEIRVFQPKK